MVDNYVFTKHYILANFSDQIIFVLIKKSSLAHCKPQMHVFFHTELLIAMHKILRYCYHVNIIEAHCQFARLYFTNL